MKITHIGGPTAVLSLGGLTFLTDPAFDEPRDYQLPGRVMTKLTGPAIPAAELGPIDVVLLSHDQHKDNLDDAGRALLPSVPTGAVDSRSGHPDSRRTRPGELGVDRAAASGRRRRHGDRRTRAARPGRCRAGPRCGHRIRPERRRACRPSTSPATTRRSTWSSEIADRFAPIDVAVLFAGAARTALLDGAALTLTSEAAVEAAHLLGARDHRPRPHRGLGPLHRRPRPVPRHLPRRRPGRPRPTPRPRRRHPVG